MRSPAIHCQGLDFSMSSVPWEVRECILELIHTVSLHAERHDRMAAESQLRLARLVASQLQARNAQLASAQRALRSRAARLHSRFCHELSILSHELEEKRELEIMLGHALRAQSPKSSPSPSHPGSNLDQSTAATPTSAAFTSAITSADPVPMWQPNSNNITAVSRNIARLDHVTPRARCDADSDSHPRCRLQAPSADNTGGRQCVPATIGDSKCLGPTWRHDVPLGGDGSELTARLASPDGVRVFLAQKQRLAKAELQLRQSESVVATAAAQTASDREVICFLDRRVRELELELERCCGTTSVALAGTALLKCTGNSNSARKPGNE